MPWLLLTLPVAAWGFYKLPYWCIKDDAAAIQANGSRDSLHVLWHALGWLFRAVVAVGFAEVGALPLAADPTALWIGMGGLLAAGAGWFMYVFNPGLNEATGKPRYYVSFDPRAAFFPDRWLAGKARRFFAATEPMVGLPSMTTYQDYAGTLLRGLLTTLLLGGVAALLLCGLLLWLRK